MKTIMVNHFQLSCWALVFFWTPLSPQLSSVPFLIVNGYCASQKTLLVASISFLSMFRQSVTKSCPFHSLSPNSGIIISFEVIIPAFSLVSLTPVSWNLQSIPHCAEIFLNHEFGLVLPLDKAPHCPIILSMVPQALTDL